MSRDSLKIKKIHKNPTRGLSQKGRDYINRKTGSKLKRPVTKTSGLSKTERGRKKSFCARMGGVKGPMEDSKGRPTRKALALRKWNC